MIPRIPAVCRYILNNYWNINTLTWIARQKNVISPVLPGFFSHWFNCYYCWTYSLSDQNHSSYKFVWFFTVLLCWANREGSPEGITPSNSLLLPFFCCSPLTVIICLKECSCWFWTRASWLYLLYKHQIKKISAS